MSVAHSQSDRPKFQHKQPKPAKPKRWSHQDYLDASLGKQVEIAVTNVGTMKGVLINADQFTLRVLVTHIGESELPSSHHSEMTYFKHALTAFQIRG